MVKCMLCGQNEAEWICTCTEQFYACAQCNKVHSSSCGKPIMLIRENVDQTIHETIHQLKELEKKLISQSSTMINLVSNSFILTKRRINKFSFLLINSLNQSQNNKKELLEASNDLLFETKPLNEFEKMVACLMNLPGFRSDEILKQKELEQYKKENDRLNGQILTLTERLEKTRVIQERTEIEIKAKESEVAEAKKLAKSKENELAEIHRNYRTDLAYKDKEINGLKTEMSGYNKIIQFNDKAIAVLREQKSAAEAQLKVNQNEFQMLKANERQQLNYLKKKRK